MTFYTVGIIPPTIPAVTMPTITTIPITRTQVMAVAITTTSLVKNGGNFGKESNN